MENYSRGNTKVSHTMYELSHGSNTQKARFKPLYIPIVISLYLITANSPVYVPLIISLALMLYYGIPKNEPKQVIEPKTEYIPTYSLNKIDAIAMLRNAQRNKRGL